MLPNSRYMIYRVTNPDTLRDIAHALGAAQLLEACRIPGKPGSFFRAWTTDGLCFEMPKSGPLAMVPARRPAFDRTHKLQQATT